MYGIDRKRAEKAFKEYVSNYDLCVNTGTLGLQKAAEVIEEFVKKATEE